MEKQPLVFDKEVQIVFKSILEASMCGQRSKRSLSMLKSWRMAETIQHTK